MPFWRRLCLGASHPGAAAALASVSVGLVLSTGIVLVQDQDTGWIALALTAATTAVTLFTRFNPLWCLGVAGLIGVISNL